VSIANDELLKIIFIIVVVSSGRQRWRQDLCLIPAQCSRRCLKNCSIAPDITCSTM